MTIEEVMKLQTYKMFKGEDTVYVERDAVLRLLEQSMWIPVSERLPEESLNSVIGWDAYRKRCVFVQFIDGHFQIAGKNESFDIRAWMPLPEPYKGGDANADSD